MLSKKQKLEVVLAAAEDLEQNLCFWARGNPYNPDGSRCLLTHLVGPANIYDTDNPALPVTTQAAKDYALKFGFSRDELTNIVHINDSSATPSEVKARLREVFR